MGRDDRVDTFVRAGRGHARRSAPARTGLTLIVTDR